MIRKTIPSAIFWRRNDRSRRGWLTASIIANFQDTPKHRPELARGQAPLRSHQRESGRALCERPLDGEAIAAKPADVGQEATGVDGVRQVRLLSADRIFGDGKTGGAQQPGEGR